jgi:ABC-type transport system substrate-binding protein
VIDPIDSWDSASNDVISQVAETLFWYNVTNPSLPLEPLLADNYSWDVTNTELTVNIKHGVYFHDGTILNASTVKWNMDRILYFINATGDLPPTTLLAFPASIYFHNGVSIMNRTEVVDADTVIIYLNMPFASFLPLLSYTASSIISPTSHSATEYIDLITGTLIGTGPFVYDGYVMDTEVNFHAFENYWNGQANITNLIFEVIFETATRNQAMLNKDIHFLLGADYYFVDLFEADPLIHVEELGPDLIYWYLAFDTWRVPTAWREAICKAINYDYIIEEIRLGHAVRGPPAVPEGMPGHDPTVVVPQYNVTEARLVMQSLGYGTGWDVGKHNATGFYPGTDEALWSAAAFFTDEFGHPIDVNYHQGSLFNRDLNDLLFFDLDRIGIDTDETPRDWGEFLDDGENGNLKGMWYVGWGPDYIDAFNMLDPLFNPASAASFINLTDSEILGWLAAAAVETNITTRYGIFSDLQHKLFEVLYAHTPLMASLGRDVHIVYPLIDIPPPVITIISPEAGDTFGTDPPIYSIDVNSTDLDTIWYTLDNGATNIIISELNGVINEDEWDDQPDGYVTIRFYANDTFGGEGTAQVIVTKDTSPPEEPPVIPGASLLVIYLTLFIGIPILIWQRKKIIKH